MSTSSDSRPSSTATACGSLPRPSSHAQLRWLQRSSGQFSETTVLEAWREAVPVGLPQYNFHSARLHSPSGTIIGVCNGVIVTVLNRGEQQVNDDHLHSCPSCGHLYEVGPDGRDCHWCRDAESERTESVVRAGNGGVRTDE